MKFNHIVTLNLSPSVVAISDDNGFDIGALITPLVQAEIYVAPWLYEIINFMSPIAWWYDLKIIYQAIKSDWSWLWKKPSGNGKSNAGKLLVLA